MSKYSKDFKLKVVSFYFDNNCGCTYIANQFNIPSKSIVDRWVNRVKEHGEQGLEKNFKSSYSGDFNKNVIEYMHKNNLSASEAACYFKLGCVATITKWEHIYNEKDIQALYEEKRDRKKKMKLKSTKNKSANVTEKDLLKENKRLRMENAYLKKIANLSSTKVKIEIREKVIVIDELRHGFKLKALLEYIGVKRSTFYQNLKMIKCAKDKYAKIKEQIIAIYHENKGRYGFSDFIRIF